MARDRLLLPARIVLLLTLLGSPASAATIDFTGINAAQVSSPAGQDFTYVLGSGPTTGVINVRRISGDMSLLTTGSSPDPGGIYIWQQEQLTPALFRFTFDQPRGFLITSNETLTALETNTFSLPSGGSPWTVISYSDASVTKAGSQVSFVGHNHSPPYGQFAVSAAAGSFDFLVTNAPGYPYYGSALSIETVDVTTSARATSWASLKKLYR